MAAKPAPASQIEGVSLEPLARKHGTPLYVYSHAALTGNFARIRDAFKAVDPLVAFSVKCNTNGAILRTLVREGAGLDIVSGGELERGLLAGADPAKIVFAGVGKSREEIARAIEAGIRLFNIESEAEAELIAEVARKLKKIAPAALRVNPDVDAATHAYITTGKKENKFGIPFEAALGVFGRIAKLKGISLRAIHCHIGSQITKIEPYAAALGRVRELVEALRAAGHEIDTLNLGGGFGIDYQAGKAPMDVKALAKRLVPEIKKLGVRIILEPGRSIAGPAGFLLTRVHYVKPGEAKKFAIVDGAMNDLIRPSLYDAYHRIERCGGDRKGPKSTYDVVGPICESGDFLGKGREMGPLEPGDLLLVHDAGAYGMAMASNYNSRPRPAEVLVKGTKAWLIRRRETLEDLTGPEETPGFLK